MTQPISMGAKYGPDYLDGRSPQIRNGPAGPDMLETARAVLSDLRGSAETLARAGEAVTL